MHLHDVCKFMLQREDMWQYSINKQSGYEKRIQNLLMCPEFRLFICLFVF